MQMEKKQKETLCWKYKLLSLSEEAQIWDLPGGPVVKTSPSNAEGAGSIPGQGAKIPDGSQPKHQNIKQKQYCNKFNKDFKNGPHQKHLKKKKEETQICIVNELSNIRK